MMDILWLSKGQECFAQAAGIDEAVNEIQSYYVAKAELEATQSKFETRPDKMASRDSCFICGHPKFWRITSGGKRAPNLTQRTGALQIVEANCR
jgi:hypothetical protein